MTRRIVLAVLGLLAVVLGAITIPLGLLTAAQDRRDFSDETKFTAGTVANVAEEHLGDQASGSLLNQLVSALGERGDLVAVFGQDGVKVAGTARAPRLTARQLNRAQTAAFPEIYSPDDYVVVVTPIRKDSGRGNVGSVAVARPITSVDQRIATLWLIIGGVSAAGMLVAALVATGLASWVRRPLGALEDAAQLLGEGQLSTRSPADAGPREVRRLAANFNMMAGRLEALVHGHQATMADVSHQLRTPLSALRLRLELLAQDSDDIVASELAGAQEEIGRLSRLVSGLLAVARAENLAGPPVSVAVSSVVEGRIAAWRPAAEEQDVILSADAVKPAQARIKDGQLEQILDNLLANALDALDQGGVIAVAVTTADERVRITVGDNGPGMSAEQKRQAFRRFAVSNSRGAGLGLAIVHRLVTSNGGTAELSDTADGGLTVTIELPAEPPPAGRPVSRHLRDLKVP